MNWGVNATKKMIVLGLIAVTATVPQNAVEGRTVEVALASSTAAGLAVTIAWRPMPIRYAAPIHLITTNAAGHCSTKTPTPSSERVIATALPTVAPKTDARAVRVP